MAIQRQTEDVQKWPSFDGTQVFQEFDTPPAPPPLPRPPHPHPHLQIFPLFTLGQRTCVRTLVLRGNQNEPEMCPKGTKMVQVFSN